MYCLNLYPVDNAIDFLHTYSLDSDLSNGWRYPPLEQLGSDDKSVRAESESVDETYLITVSF